MRPLPLLAAIALRLLLLASPVSAQTLDQYAAWTSLIRSPLGGVLAAPLEGGASATPRRAVSLNMGSWRFGPGDDETSNIGASMQFPAGRVAVVLNGMMTSVKGCTACGGTSLGGGIIYALDGVALGGNDGARLDIALQPMANYGTWGEGEISALTAALSIPVSLTVPLGPVTLRPFVTPGYAYGRASDGTDAYGATRSLLGYGLAVGNRSGSLQAHIGTMEVRLDEAPTVTALGLTVRF